MSRDAGYFKCYLWQRLYLREPKKIHKPTVTLKRRGSAFV